MRTTMTISLTIVLGLLGIGPSASQQVTVPVTARYHPEALTASAVTTTGGTASKLIHLVDMQVSAGTRSPSAVLFNKPMTVSIVKSAEPGCEPACPQWIAAQGMIVPDTLRQFNRVFSSLGDRKLPVVIDSAGGVVEESLAIGRLIRARNLDVAVARTVLTPCDKTNPDCKPPGKNAQPLGRPVGTMAKCASSCAFILAAGRRRLAGPVTFVGVHQLKTLRTTAQIEQKYRLEWHMVSGVPTQTRRIISERLINKRTTAAKTPQSAYDQVARYFTEMGVSDAIVPILRSTPNSSIHWLTRSELTTTALATEAAEADALFTKPASAESTSNAPVKTP